MPTSRGARRTKEESVNSHHPVYLHSPYPNPAMTSQPASPATEPSDVIALPMRTPISTVVVWRSCLSTRLKVYSLSLSLIVIVSWSERRSGVLPGRLVFRFTYPGFTRSAAGRGAEWMDNSCSAPTGEEAHSTMVSHPATPLSPHW
jgi:hypothetical protein